MCRSGATCPAASTRARSRWSRCRSIPRLMTFTGGFDMESVTGFEIVFDERGDAEAIARLGPTEHYTMVMHAGDMAWVLPELVWHLEDLRRRNGVPEPLHRSPRLEVRDGDPRRDGRRRALRRVSLAVPARAGRTTTRSSSNGGTTATGRAWSPTPTSRASSRRRPGRRFRPRRRSRRTGERSRRLRISTPPHVRSTSRQRRFSTACSSSRIASRWRTASRRAFRSSTTSSSSSH